MFKKFISLLKQKQSIDIPGKSWKGFFVDIKEFDNKIQINVFDKLGNLALQRIKEIIKVGNKKVFRKTTLCTKISEPMHLNDYMAETDVSKKIVDTVRDLNGKYLGQRISKVKEMIQINDGRKTYNLKRPFIKSKEVTKIIPDQNVTTRFERGTGIRTQKINNLTGDITIYPKITI